MTQQELAENIGMKSKASIAGYEHGSTEPPVSTIEAIAQALDVTVLELLGCATSTLEHAKPDITIFTTEELLKEIVRRIS